MHRVWCTWRGFVFSSPQYTGAVKTSVRKSYFGISNLTYRGGDFVHSLTGSNVTTDVSGRNITLSIDLSRNDEKGKDDHNRVIDVRELQQKFDDLDFVQLDKEKWLEDALQQAAERAKEPALLWLEFLFKDGTKRIAPVSLKDESSSFWLYLYQRSALALPKNGALE